MIVEDHRMFADLLSMAFAAAPDVATDIVEIASTVADGRAACDKFRPDVVLLDLDLPDGSGVAVAEHVAVTLPETRVIVVSGQASTFVCPPHLADCIYGVVNTADAFESLQVLLAGVMQSQAKSGPKGRRHNSRHRLGSVLSRREREVLVLIGQRLSSSAIAEQIGISRHTVNAHRKNIARKLDVKGLDLVLVAYQYREQLRRLQ